MDLVTKRLKKLETLLLPAPRAEVWLNVNGLMSNAATGEKMTYEEFKVQNPESITVGLDLKKA